jgi:hypothetical protein
MNNPESIPVLLRKIKVRVTFIFRQIRDFITRISQENELVDTLNVVSVVYESALT